MIINFFTTFFLSSCHEKRKIGTFQGFFNFSFFKIKANVFLDPDPYSNFGSRSSTSANTDLIRMLNPGRNNPLLRCAAIQRVMFQEKSLIRVTCVERASPPPRTTTTTSGPTAGRSPTGEYPSGMRGSPHPHLHQFFFMFHWFGHPSSMCMLPVIG